MAGRQKKAADLNARIAFYDESGFSLRPNVRRTWAPKGRTPIIRHQFNWKRLHSVGTISCKADGSDPRLHVRVQYEAANADNTITYVEELQQEIDEPIILIWDGLPAHRAKKVTAFVATQTRVTTVRLPAYAPELNPVEYLWSALKTKHTANACDSRIEQLSERIVKAKECYKSQVQTLQGFLKASSLYTKETIQVS